MKAVQGQEHSYRDRNPKHGRKRVPGPRGPSERYNQPSDSLTASSIFFLHLFCISIASRKIEYFASKSFFSRELTETEITVPGAVISTCPQPSAALSGLSATRSHHDIPQFFATPIPALLAGLCGKPAQHCCAGHNCRRTRMRYHHRHVARIGKKLHQCDIL